MKNRRVLTLVIYLAILVLAFSWMTGIFGGQDDGPTYSQIVDLFRQEQVRSFTVREDYIYLELYKPYQGETSIVAYMADAESFRREMTDTFRAQTESGILESYDFLPEESLSPYDFVLPLLLVGMVLLFVWFMMMSRANGGGNPMANFGKARTVLGVPDGSKVTFDDVAGADEEKEELHEVVDILRNPKNIPRSVPGFPMGCCWLALPVPVRHYLPGR